jgi:hypothetical protein
MAIGVERRSNFCIIDPYSLLDYISWIMVKMQRIKYHLLITNKLK